MNKSIGERIFQGTIVIVLVGILAKLSAFILGTVLAAYLGTTYESDAFYMVAGIKDVVYPMLSVGIWKVFLPIYKEKITQNDLGAANLLANKTISFFSLISFIAVTLMILFAEPIVSIIAPGFYGETKTLCVKLLRIASPMNVVIIASAVYASMLQCHNKFFGSQIREAVTHLPTILSALFLYQYFGIEVLAFSLVIGGIIRLIVELPFVDWNYKFKPDFHFYSNDFLLMLRRIPSALVTAGVNQINTLIDKIMASLLPVGAISGLSYGHKLMNVFSGLLSTAIATALYPQMIELIALKKINELGKLIEKVINVFCILMFPVTIGCIFFKNELVYAVFQRGAFDEQSTVLTSGIFSLYIVGIFFIACNSIISNLFFGFGNTRTPMLISLVNLFINIIFNLILIQFLGVNGIALATSLAAIITFFVRIKAAESYVKLNKNMLTMTAGKTILAAVIACAIPRLIFNLYPINKYLILVFSASIGILSYFIMVKFMNISEIDYVQKLLLQKIRKKEKTF